ncbi:hypothetical protein [Qipengyuania gelatinilytica]|uniref:Uncharacterized protein n=1 Tax=Qipengyuania gelatinilytica TaxID=2867231 RepID=A0ABX8ZYG6_9SPHN|nr:hypothetical protein [Qipengyuania gelatinilytica]QZD93939.1 hypothetical protein K3136_07380 [Qipengyuania gelatinilytica]
MRAYRPLTFKLALLSAIALLGAVALPSVSRATPPDVVVITDTLFGMSKDRVFVLRTSRDNLGLHMSQRSETWLVAIDPQTGEETFWPVHAARRDSDWNPETQASVWEVTTDDNPLAVNPYEILAQFDGLPVEPMANDKPAPIGAAKDGTLKATLDPERVFELQVAPARKRYVQSVQAMARSVVDAERLAPIKTRDVFEDSVEGVSECSFVSLGYRGLLQSGGQQYLSVRVTCNSYDWIEGHSLIQLVPISG